MSSGNGAESQESTVAALHVRHFSPNLVRLFILRWALTLVALLASGAAGAAVPETQPARAQGGDASRGNASAAPRGQPVRQGRRADASCDDSQAAATTDAEPAGRHADAVAAEAIWLSQLLAQAPYIAASLPAHFVSESTVGVIEAAPHTKRRLALERRTGIRDELRALQPRAPPRA